MTASERTSHAREAPTTAAADGDAAIGGRWAISLRAYLISAPVIIGLFMLSENGALADLTAAIEWFHVQVGGYLAFGLVLLLADRTYLRHRRIRPVPTSVVVATGALAGATRGVIIAVLVQWAGLPSTNPVWFRALIGALLGAFWLTATAKFLATREELRREYRSLVAAQVAQLAQEGITDLDREQIRTSLLAAVRTDLSPADRAAADDSAPDAPSEAELAAAVRGVSHRLWQSSPPVPSASLRQMAAHTVHAGVFRPRWSLAVFASLGVVALGRTHGWVEGVLVSGTYAASVLVAAAVINRWARRWRRSPREFMAVAAGVLLLVPMPIAVLMIALDFPNASVVTDVVAAWVYTLGVMPLTSSSIAPTTRRRIAVQALRHDVDERQLRLWAYQSEQAQAAQRLARYLHGTVQADLAATALRRSLLPDSAESEGAGPDDDEPASDKRAPATALRAGPLDVEEILAASSRALAAGAPPGPATPAELRAAMDDVAGRWHGLVHVALVTDPAALSAVVAAGLGEATVQVVEEVIQNASRHGGASTVEITVTCAQQAGESTAEDSAGAMGVDAVTIVAVDDGQPMAASPTPGIGMQMVSRLASAWSLLPLPESAGTRVTVTIPMPR